MISKRLTFANVMASVAMFIALGGASYAAVSLPRNSVGTKQLRPQAVKRTDLAPRSVSKSKLANRAVTKRALSRWIRGQLRRRAAAGPTGPTGPRGPQGQAGPRGPGALPVRYSAAASATPVSTRILEAGGLTVSVSCALGGGGTAMNFSVRSAQAGTLNETVISDSGTDPTGGAPADFTSNLQLDFPAGVTQNTGGPTASDGYSRVAVQGIYTSPSSTVDLQLFALVVDESGADAGRCSINGMAVPA